MDASSESADTFSEHPCDPEFSVIAGTDSRMGEPQDKAAEHLQVRTGPLFEGGVSICDEKMYSSVIYAQSFSESKLAKNEK
jgi:hypothetical protein